MVPSCISSFKLGTTMEMVGSVVKSVGKLVKGRLLVVGTLEKSTQGLCLRAYAPEVQIVDPAAGRSSEKPRKVLPAAMSSAPRLSVENGPDGQASVVTPWLEPEKRSR